MFYFFQILPRARNFKVLNFFNVATVPFVSLAKQRYKWNNTNNKYAAVCTKTSIILCLNMLFMLLLSVFISLCDLLHSFFFSLIQIQQIKNDFPLIMFFIQSIVMPLKKKCSLNELLFDVVVDADAKIINYYVEMHFFILC